MRASSIPARHLLAQPLSYDAAAASAWIVGLIRFREPWKSSYEATYDTFQAVKFAILPCAVLCLIFNEGSLKLGYAHYGQEVRMRMVH